ncbi:MAG: hypothetical protein HFJ38_08530 [Bacilli bacterium]|nr:hypothetical protein [Bacilli bacterium]
MREFEEFGVDVQCQVLGSISQVGHESVESVHPTDLASASVINLALVAVPVLSLYVLAGTFVQLLVALSNFCVAVLGP